MNIYQINSSVENIMAMLDAGYSEGVDEETGEVFDLAEKLEELELTKEEKIRNLALFCKNQAAFIDSLKAEKARIDMMIKAENSKTERAKEYLREVTDGKGVKDAQYVISYRKTESVDIANGAKVPDEYLVYSDPRPDKVALKKAIKAGNTFEGICLREGLSMSVK
jgi:hypothetical protein